MARGEYIATMDADDVCLPKRLQTQLDFMQQHPEIGVVGSSMQITDRQLTPLDVWNYPEQHAPIAYSILIFGSGFGHPSTMIRRELLVEVGGYRATLRAAGDLDLWTRLASRTRFANLPAVLMKYRRHERATGNERHVEQQLNTLAIRRAALQQIWQDLPEAKLNRLSMLGQVFWKESITIKRDLKQLVEKMKASNWIEPSDKPSLFEEIDRRVQVESPHLYRKLRQWFRYRIGRHLSFSRR